MSDKSFLPTPMIEATHALAQNLLSSESFVHFQKAKQILEADATANGLLDNLAQVQARVRKAQTSGAVTREDLQALRDLQAKVQATAVITEYATSEQDAKAFLREINNETSQSLGLNFGLIARRSSCC